MSDTPETDHLEDQLGSAAKFSHPIIWKHARQLERGRDEAIRQLENLKASAIHTCHDQCQRPMCVLRRERDEWAAMCGRYKQERDEARKKLDEEMKWHHQTHQELVQTQCKLLDIEYDKLKSKGS